MDETEAAVEWARTYDSMQPTRATMSAHAYLKAHILAIEFIHRMPHEVRAWYRHDEVLRMVKEHQTAIQIELEMVKLFGKDWFEIATAH